MTDTQSFRTRFRFWLGKSLTVSESEFLLQLGDREIVLSSPTPDTPIRDSKWLILNARGFSSDTAARTFGKKLKAAADIAAVTCRIGINSGLDLPTSAFSEQIKKAVLESDGTIIRNNVHGLDVFLDSPNVRIFSFTGKGTVSADPKLFFSSVEKLFSKAENISQKARDLILLMNFALLRTEHVAQIVLATSAIEMLGQQMDWTTPQRELLKNLAKQAKDSKAISSTEGEEVADAIMRGIHRVGLRQGVTRLLHENGLGGLRSRWDELYSERSKLVHGLAPKPNADYGQQAHKTVSLCGHIMLKLLSQELPEVGEDIDRFYPVDA